MLSPCSRVDAAASSLLLGQWMAVLARNLLASACSLAAIACSTPHAEPATRSVPYAVTGLRARAAAVAASAAASSTGDPAAALKPAPVFKWPESNQRIPLNMPVGRAEAWAPVHPPSQGGAPVSVFFHGITAYAQLECPVAWGAMQHGWVVCADGNIPYGGGFTWNNSGSQARVDAAVGALTARHQDLVGAQRGVIIGYSIGAMAAWYLLEHSSERWTALAFINAEFGVDPKVVQAKGLKRVAMIAARGDLTFRTMSRTAASLAREGIDARFFSFESRNGHFFDDETANKLVGPLEWALTGN